MEVSDIVAIVACLLFGYVVVSFLLGGVSRRRKPGPDVGRPAPPALRDETAAGDAEDDPHRRSDDAPR